ncbi:hypothetical protein JYB64_08800 [Algoriphagus aestuarii]|nr:hypothetical protein [Algoriphagus aestuarii]
MNLPIRFFFSLLLVFSCFLYPVNAQELELKIRPKLESSLKTDYYFSKVSDLRKNQEEIGEVFYLNNSKIPVSFNGELKVLLKDYFNSQLEVNRSESREVKIRILNVAIQESLNHATKLYEGILNLKLGFYLEGNINPIHLVDYSNQVKYQRSLNSLAKLQETTLDFLDESLRYFDSWMKSQTGTNRNLAQSVLLNVIYHLPESTEDTVYYDINQPLKWEYFKDRPSVGSKYNATITCSFSVEGSAQMVDGIIQQNILIQAYMLPNQSWVKNPDDYGINHEQKHFDVVKIVVDRLIHRLKKLDLDTDFYEAKINTLYFDAYREMNRLQELYDSQTQNGLDKDAQERWNIWIVKGLKGDWEELDRQLAK